MTPDVAARVWRDIASGRGHVMLAEDRGGWRHLVVALGAGPRPDWSKLSARERRVLARAARGEPQKVIALELRLSASTVSATLRGVRERLGFARISELARAYRANVEEASEGSPGADR